MTLDEQRRAAERVEEDRRQREKELLILLLLMLGSARRDAIAVLRNGGDPMQPIRNGLLGNPGTGHAGAAYTFAKWMALAHQDGYRRGQLLIGERAFAVRENAGRMAELIALYLPTANQAVTSMADTIDVKLRSALLGIAATEMAANARETINGAFDATGYTRANPFALRSGAERAIVTAHAAGTWFAWQDNPRVTGFRHITTLDGHETSICHDRAALMLPKDDPYWLTNWVSLHFGCRSIILPIIGWFRASQWRPTVPVMPGFGAAPSRAFGVLVGRPQAA